MDKQTEKRRPVTSSLKNQLTISLFVCRMYFAGIACRLKKSAMNFACAFDTQKPSAFISATDVVYFSTLAITCCARFSAPNRPRLHKSHSSSASCAPPRRSQAPVMPPRNPPSLRVPVSFPQYALRLQNAVSRSFHHLT